MRQTASPPGLLGGMKGMALEECTRRDPTHFHKLVVAYRNTAHYGPLTHLAILHLYISAGGIGRGLLPQTIIDFPPTPQSSIYTLLLGALGVGYFLKRLLTSHPPRNRPLRGSRCSSIGDGRIWVSNTAHVV